MSNRIDALKALEQRIAAGEWVPSDDWVTWPANNFLNWTLCNNAYNGSLDAALALHEAILPGWHWNLAPGYCHVIPPHDNGDQDALTGHNQSPARAWLIAIIRALIALEEDNG